MHSLNTKKIVKITQVLYSKFGAQIFRNEMRNQLGRTSYKDDIIDIQQQDHNIFIMTESKHGDGKQTELEKDGLA